MICGARGGGLVGGFYLDVDIEGGRGGAKRGGVFFLSICYKIHGA